MGALWIIVFPNGRMIWNSIHFALDDWHDCIVRDQSPFLVRLLPRPPQPTTVALSAAVGCLACIFLCRPDAGFGGSHLLILIQHKDYQHAFRSHEESRSVKPAIPYDVAYRIAGRLLTTARYRVGKRIRVNHHDIARRISAGRCEVTGIHFRVLPTEGLNSNPWAPSLDRIDPAKSYTTRNIQIVLWSINRFKSDMNMDDFAKLLDEIRSS